MTYPYTSVSDIKSQPNAAISYPRGGKFAAELTKLIPPCVPGIGAIGSNRNVILLVIPDGIYLKSRIYKSTILDKQPAELIPFGAALDGQAVIDSFSSAMVEAATYTPTIAEFNDLLSLFGGVQ